MTVPGIVQTQYGMDRASAELGLTKIAWALALYHAKTHKYPAALDELVPQYLPAQLTDPFGGGPYFYALKDTGYTHSTVWAETVSTITAPRLFPPMTLTPARSKKTSFSQLGDHMRLSNLRRQLFKVLAMVGRSGVHRAGRRVSSQLLDRR